MPRQRPIIIWRIVDGKPGHESQSAGLAGALSRLLPSAMHTIQAERRLAAVRFGSWLRRRYPEGDKLPSPQLIVGAGHATYGPMLAARRAHGGKVIALMKPSLPLAWFDLCLVPAHDRAPHRANIIETTGVLNRIRPSTGQRPDRGLILLGGPSRHYRWQEDSTVSHVVTVARADPTIRWTLATSRRTPQSTTGKLRALHAENVAVITPADVDSDWLPNELARAARVWVSEDSVSMVYEALTAGAATGLLPVDSIRTSRVSRGVQKLIETGLVRTFSAWRDGAPLAPPATQLDESARCARWIVDRWL